MSDRLERYRQMRGRSLARLALIRQLRAPEAVRRREQLFMWGIRQWRTHPDFCGRSLNELPGWARNEARFIGIYDPPAGSA